MTHSDLKIGQRIRRWYNWQSGARSFDVTGVVEAIDDNEVLIRMEILHCDASKRDYEVGDTAWFGTDKKAVLELVSNGFVAPAPTPAFKSHIETKPTMPSLSQFVKRMLLSADDKLLIDRGIEDPTGVPTSEGREALMQVLWNDNRAKVIELVKAQKAEEKAEKSDK